MILRGETQKNSRYTYELIKEDKTAIFIVFPVSSGQIMMTKKLVAACSAYDAKLMRIPSTAQGITQRIEEFNLEVKDYQNLVHKTRDTLIKRLETLSKLKHGNRCSFIEELRLGLIKEKAVYSTLNQFKQSGALLVGCFWAPAKDSDYIMIELEHLKERDPSLSDISISQMTHSKRPPTYFELPEFMEAFQSIVDTYSVPKYREINPALVTIVTFSYQFGVMFGDVAHGFCILIFAIYLIQKEEKLKESTAGIAALKLRYLLLMLGIFSVYCGFIYNDFIGLKLIGIGSCYTAQANGIKEIYNRDDKCVYPVGFDWVWGKSANELVFSNSFKMKLSIIIGVIHMTLGLVFKALNNIHDSDYITLFFECIPQVVFFLAIFGYMVFCIILKWLQEWAGRSPPSIVNIFINLFQTVDFKV